MPFRALVGLEDATGRLRRAVAAGKLPHALLFAGPEGVGKHAAAIALAQLIHCRCRVGEGASVDSCGACADCRRVESRNHPDVAEIFPITKNEAKRLLRRGNLQEPAEEASDEDAEDPHDEASDPTGSQAARAAMRREIHIWQIRSSPAPHDWPGALERRLQFRSFEGGRPVGIVDESHLMNASAGTTFLKTLEEPPGRTVLILVSSRPEELLDTVRSRCHRIDFPSLPLPLLARELAARLSLPADRARSLAEQAEGSLGDALRMADSGYAEQRRLVEALLDSVAAGRAPGVATLAGALVPPAGKGSAREEARGLLERRLAILADCLRVRLLRSAREPVPSAATVAVAAAARSALRTRWALARLNVNVKLALDALGLDLSDALAPGAGAGRR